MPWGGELNIKRYLLKNGKIDSEFQGISGSGVDSGEVRITSDGILLKRSGVNDKTFGSKGSIDLSGYKKLIIETDVLNITSGYPPNVNLDLTTVSTIKWSDDQNYIARLPVQNVGKNGIILDITNVTGKKFFVFYSWSNIDYTVTITSIGLS